MMQTFLHFNKSRKNKSYSILETLISLFIASLLLLTILGFISTNSKITSKMHDKVVSSIESQNTNVMEFLNEKE